MSDMQIIEEKVKQYVKSTAAIPPDFELKNETLLFEEGLFDSMGFMTLINFIQEELKIQPNDDDLIVENFESINAIVNFISKKQAALINT
jgi:acyl carrier protein